MGVHEHSERKLNEDVKIPTLIMLIAHFHISPGARVLIWLLIMKVKGPKIKLTF